MKRTPILFLLAAVACSTSPGKPVAPPPAAPASPAPAALSRTNPNIVEETETYFIERLPKSSYTKVDDRHVKHSLIAKPVEFFKEDDQYFYIYVPKTLPEETASRDAELQARKSQPASPAPERSAGKSAVPLSDFEDLAPPRTQARLHWEPVSDAGLPDRGMWRASFVLADVNGDGVPDIVSPPSRLGDGQLHIWIGDGHGKFSAWPLSFTEGGKAATRFSVDYGGVAVGDIDGDGKIDVVAASHGGGLVSLFGDGKGGFEIVRTGLPRRDFSAQAAVVLDADGDGKLDIVASRDVLEQDPNTPVDKMQVRVYMFLGREKGWELRKEGIVGGLYSNSLAAWDFDGDGRKDLLTGSHYMGGLTLLWRNTGDGGFSAVSVPPLEIYAYHFGSAPGTSGKDGAPAFADAYLMQSGPPANARTFGISVYALRGGAWTRERLWRKKDPKSTVYGIAMGDLDGDGLDDVVFADSDQRRVRILFQQADGTFVEAPESEEPPLDSPGQCVRLGDLDRDGRLDLVVSKTVVSSNPNERGGWNVYLNRQK